ncbi:lipoprotein [Nocardiopsis composta]|uniref:Lipoprotein n=1 Tax=Nocardiopsis composta TaxID=157465 RepID=A0A7W8VCD6_9ACTN|nr:lipoprotein [Nocardiopsis composta]MBB5430855.1 hypothetical protein [Nocardiopsis composta]
MRRTSQILFPAVAALLLAGCSGGPPPDPGTTSEPTPRPSPSGPPEQVISEVTGLTPPDSAADLTAETEYTDDGRLILRAFFRTDRDGADAFCDAENLGVYRDPEGPSEEDREAHGAEEETVDGSVACRGTEPDEGRVQREVLVLYPEEDEAAVYVNAVEVD